MSEGSTLERVLWRCRCVAGRERYCASDGPGMVLRDIFTYLIFSTNLDRYYHDIQYKWRNWSTERLNNFPKGPKLQSEEARFKLWWSVLSVWAVEHPAIPPLYFLPECASSCSPYLIVPVLSEFRYRWHEGCSSGRGVGLWKLRNGRRQ